MPNLDTSCKECIFTEDKDLTQIGCKTDYIAKFNRLDIEIMDAYDEDKEFWVIKNRRCPSYRTNKWKYKDHTFEEQVEQISVETQIPYQIIIFANNNTWVLFPAFGMALVNSIILGGLSTLKKLIVVLIIRTASRTEFPCRLFLFCLSRL